MRNAMIALYVITVYLGFGVNQVGAYINCQWVHLRPQTINILKWQRYYILLDVLIICIIVCRMFFFFLHDKIT